MQWKPLQLTIAKHEEAECDGGRVEDADELEPEGKRANGGQTEIPGGRVQVLVPVELLDQNVLRIWGADRCQALQRWVGVAEYGAARFSGRVNRW